MCQAVLSTNSRVMSRTDKVPAHIELARGDRQEANKYTSCFQCAKCIKKLNKMMWHKMSDRGGHLRCTILRPLRGDF